MDSSKDAFCPKMQREVSLKTKSTCRLKDMTMFTLDDPILLGRINARVLISYAMLAEKILHRKKFPPIIDANICDRCIKLSFDEGKEIDE
jgi:hypothetical protein